MLLLNLMELRLEGKSLISRSTNQWKKIKETIRMLDIVPSNTHRSGSLINFAAIFACASVILASPVVVDASSTPKTKMIINL